MFIIHTSHNLFYKFIDNLAYFELDTNNINYNIADRESLHEFKTKNSSVSFKGINIHRHLCHPWYSTHTPISIYVPEEGSR